MNEILRRAILGAGLDELGVAASLEVDPKTVRRWLEGRLPYARHRWALADLLHLDETALWPELRTDQPWPTELLAVYPRRSSIPRCAWHKLFAKAKSEITILDYSSLFIAEDDHIVRIFADKARLGLNVRIALADPDSKCATGLEAGVGCTVETKLQEALVVYGPLMAISGFELRLYRSVLYNSIYRVDDELIVNQRAHGIPLADMPALHFSSRIGGDMAAMYIESIDRIWGNSQAIRAQR